MKTTSVLIVDDHRMMREALVTILERQRDIKVVGQAADGREGAEKAAKLKPDVVTLDRRDFGSLLGQTVYDLLIQRPGEFLRIEREAGRI